MVIFLSMASLIIPPRRELLKRCAGIREEINYNAGVCGCETSQTDAPCCWATSSGAVQYHGRSELSNSSELNLNQGHSNDLLMTDFEKKYNDYHHLVHFGISQPTSQQIHKSRNPIKEKFIKKIKNIYFKELCF